MFELKGIIPSNAGISWGKEKRYSGAGARRARVRKYPGVGAGEDEGKKISWCGCWMLERVRLESCHLALSSHCAVNADQRSCVHSRLEQ